MFDYRRTHNCGELQFSDIDKTVTLSGWVHRRRDHGGIIFIDLRDRFGLIQLVFNPTTIQEKLFDQASRLRSEWVISVTGKVVARTEKMINEKLPTGKIEIFIQDLEVLSPAKTPPFSICDEEIEVNEELRLKYRYLDIRRGLVANNLLLRHQVMLITRNFLSEQGFIEISTPILAKSTPEGARDYLVPSRIYPGNFYALPQSPQIFKQLLMISGMDRYFQIAACFRDEDLRADRQPEFTQIDFEMSFGTPEDIMDIIEKLMTKVVQTTLSITSAISFPKMSYKNCLEHYGTDRPDLRFEMPLVRLDDIIEQSEFTVLRDCLAQKGCIKALLVKNGSALSRREIENYMAFIAPYGVNGLAWIKCQSEGLSSNITKFFSPELLLDLQNRMQCKTNDLILIAGGEEERINQGLDHLRRKIAKERDLIDKSALNFVWVTDFPLFQWNADDKRIESVHHPFTSPHFEDIELLVKNPLQVRALAYDLVLNGYEIGGGSQRVHSSKLQKKIFETLQLSKGDIQEKFGFFVEALEYGTPPHLGVAFGLDRIIMILAKTENIRDVIAFPKTQKASDLMMQAPAKVEKKQLNELKVQIEPIEIIWA